MRVAAISDIHGNAVAFEAVIRDLRQQSPDAIVCLGDLVMRGPQPQESLSMLRDLAPLVTLRGNFEHRFTRFPPAGWSPKTLKDELLQRDFAYTVQRLSTADQDWLGNLPVEHRAQIGGVNVELYHAAPGSLNRYTWPWAPDDELCQLRTDEKTRLVMFGHMHYALIRTPRGFTVVNPGSVGLPFDGDNRASYAVIDLGEGHFAGQIRRVSYEIERAIAVARELAMPDVERFAHALRNADYPYTE